MIKFKHEADQNCFLYISPKLGEVMIDMHQWFEKCGYDFVITSVIRREGEGVSTTHEQGRAFDIRMKNIINTNGGQEFTKDTVAFFNHKYKQYAALSRSNNMKPTLVIPHGKNDNFHLHIQLNPKHENRYSQCFFKDKE